MDTVNCYPDFRGINIVLYFLLALARHHLHLTGYTLQHLQPLYRYSVPLRYHGRSVRQETPRGDCKGLLNQLWTRRRNGLEDDVYDDAMVGATMAGKALLKNRSLRTGNPVAISPPTPLRAYGRGRRLATKPPSR